MIQRPLTLDCGGVTAECDSLWSMLLESHTIDCRSVKTVSGGEPMTGWCWDMRDEPYEDEDEDGVSTELPLAQMRPPSSGLLTGPVPQRVVR